MGIVAGRVNDELWCYAVLCCAVLCRAALRVEAARVCWAFLGRALAKPSIASSFEGGESIDSLYSQAVPVPDRHAHARTHTHTDHCRVLLAHPNCWDYRVPPDLLK